MSIFSKLGSWAKKAVSNVGNAIGKVANVALPLAGFAVGLVSPKLGETIGNIADKIGNKVSSITGIGDGKPGILGIGDGLPGILGIGTGKNINERIKELALETINGLEAKVKTGAQLTAPEKLELEAAKKQAGDDMKKDGINPLFLLGGALLGLFALRK